MIALQIVTLLLCIAILYVLALQSNKQNKIMAELDDLKTAVNDTLSELSDVATQLKALEGTTPAPGVLEGLATQLEAGVAAAKAAVAPPAPAGS